MTVFSVSLTECLPPSISTYPSSSTCLLKPYFILTEKNCGTSTGCGWVGAYTAGRKWIGASRRGIGGRCKSPRILCMHFLLPRSASYVISRMVRPLWRIRSVNEYASCEGIKHSESAGWYRGKCYSSPCGPSLGYRPPVIFYQAHEKIIGSPNFDQTKRKY